MSKPVYMGNLPFHLLFPEIGVDETRVMTATLERMAPDCFAFFEFYCIDPACDCRQVVVDVRSLRLGGRTVTTIVHRFEPRAAATDGLAQTSLDPLNPQSNISVKMLDLFVSAVLTADYAERLVRHYEKVKAAVAQPGHPIHAAIGRMWSSRMKTRFDGPSESTRAKARAKRKRRR
jgi:hypothetical protein